MAHVSNKKIIISGNMVEIYTYEKSIGYNFHTKKNTSSVSIISVKPKIHKSSLYRAKGKIKRLVNANIYQWCDKDNVCCAPQFITYTFAENLTDITKANKLFSNHMKRLNYFVFKSKKALLKYLTVIEFQKRGAVHFHVIFFNLPYIDSAEERRTRTFADVWTHGFIEIKQTINVSGLGSYITKYLAKDLEDTRLLGRRRYFISRYLKKPTILTRQNEVDEIANILPKDALTYQNTYKSDYNGDVLYQEYHLNDFQEIKNLIE